ncbi:hypothetical protein RHSIM_Rhsim07G0003700 [Rhododendron simsii]|uniref:Gag-pol polyprotein n=1 Tax=Rhododendron simsii TaxID=118357 RepID=A0A834LKG3_RHOSS|nr:hypothetical protein RHSIM_Rhsim07G0003700 [Rhododendron simsii]
MGSVWEEDNDCVAVRPPLLNNIDFDYWEARMRAYLGLMNERVWESIEYGYDPPTVTDTETNETRLKTYEEFDQTERDNLHYNYQALNAIFCAITDIDCGRISKCVIAKEALDILRVAHEDTPAMKYRKLQNLDIMFEECRMQESETIRKFYLRLSDIVISMTRLGESVSESRIVRKILRSLPKRFSLKVSIIECKKDIGSMTVEKLVESLEIYEINHFPFMDSDSSNNQGMSSKSVQLDNVESDGEVDMDDEEMAKFEMFREFLKFSKGDSSSQAQKVHGNNMSHPSRGDKYG